MNRGLPIKETSLGVLIMLAVMFIISIYSLCVMLITFEPRILGYRINALVIKVDSIKSHKNNNIYHYFGKIKFKNLKNNEIIEDYGFENKLQKNDNLNLYYDEKYGLYDPKNQNVYFIFLVISFVISVILGAFFYNYFASLIKK